MHIKQTPEDFAVEELTDIDPSAAGAHALYRLEKRGWTTPDALQVVRRRWQLESRRLSCGGLKDRHAHTVQYLSILRGPQRQLNQQGIQLTYLGQLDHPYTSQHIRANRFEIIVRDLSASEAAAALQALDEVRDAGVPNYFDDQRFGSVSAPGRFVARHLILGELEEALRLALAAPYRHDRAAQKKEKEILRGHWGNWSKCREHLRRGDVRNVVDYLVAHPQDFRGAVERLRPELRGLYLSAYQSHLWNRLLALWLQEHLPAADLLAVPLRLGSLPMPRTLAEEQKRQLAELTLPLPSRVALPDDDPRQALLLRVLSAEGLVPDQFKLKNSKMFFSKGDRRALCLPAHLQGETGRDDLHHGQLRLTLRFELPRGSYATLLVKRITRLEIDAADEPSL
jgi:tRNA pseudouridine13 synthase